MADIVFFYTTAPNSETAARIGRALVEEKLAACVNIHAEMRSIYAWEGRVEIGLETPLIVKTTAARAEAVRSRIAALHPHDCPCITALAVNEQASHRPFFDWIREATNA